MVRTVSIVTYDAQLFLSKMIITFVLENNRESLLLKYTIEFETILHALSTHNISHSPHFSKGKATHHFEVLR